MESGIHGFGIQNPANGIRNPTIIVIQDPGSWLLNLESMDVESGIYRHGIRNPQRGIRNPRLLDYLTWGDKYMALMLKGHFHVIFLFLSS